jgi:hypothetical protein
VTPRVTPNPVLLAVLGVVALGAVAIGFPSCTQLGETYGVRQVAASTPPPTPIAVEASKDDYCLVCLVRATPAPTK